MRLFVAIDLPEDVRAKLAEFSARHAPAARGYKWVKAANLHLTIKFIGERPESEVAAISKTLGGVAFPAPIEIALEGIGSFPNVLFARVNAPMLATLAAAIEQSLEPLGIAKESRPFTPHLTLARRKEGGRLPPGLGASENFGTFTANEFILYQSVLSAGGSQYTPLRRFKCPKP